MQWLACAAWRLALTAAPCHTPHAPAVALGHCPRVADRPQASSAPGATGRRGRCSWMGTTDSAQCPYLVDALRPAASSRRECTPGDAQPVSPEGLHWGPFLAAPRRCKPCLEARGSVYCSPYKHLKYCPRGQAPPQAPQTSKTPLILSQTHPRPALAAPKSPLSADLANFLWRRWTTRGTGTGWGSWFGGLLSKGLMS